MRSLGWALIQGDWCPYKKRGSHRKTQAEIGDMRPLAKDAPCPAGGKQASTLGPSPRVFGGRLALPTPCAQASGLQDLWFQVT